MTGLREQLQAAPDVESLDKLMKTIRPLITRSAASPKTKRRWVATYQKRLAELESKSGASNSNKGK